MAAPRCVFSLAVALTIAASGTAMAAAPAPNPVANCKARGVSLAKATVEKLPDDGKRKVYHLVTPKKRRFVAFVGPRGRCSVVPVKRAAARAWGNFWPGKGRVKAFVLEDPRCTDKESDCRSVLAFKLKKSTTMLGAFRIRGCDYGHKATALKATDTQDSIEVQCHSSVGAGDYSVSTTVFMLANSRPKKVLTADLGHVQQGSEEGAKGQPLICIRGPQGHIKAVTHKGLDLLETLEPSRDSDGSDMGVLKRWKFDAKKWKYVRHGGTRSRELKTRKRCRRDKLE